MSETDANLLMDRAQSLYMENPSTENAEHFLNLAKRLRDQGMITDRDIEFVYETINPVRSCQ